MFLIIRSAVFSSSVRGVKGRISIIEVHLDIVQVLLYNNLAIQGISPNKLPDVRAGFQVAQEEFGASEAVAAGVVVREGNAVVAAQLVEPMADARQDATAHLHRADISDIPPPGDLIIPEAVF